MPESLPDTDASEARRERLGEEARAMAEGIAIALADVLASGGRRDVEPASSWTALPARPE